jgi:hypothetical protein
MHNRGGPRPILPRARGDSHNTGTKPTAAKLIILALFSLGILGGFFWTPSSTVWHWEHSSLHPHHWFDTLCMFHTGACFTLMHVSHSACLHWCRHPSSGRLSSRGTMVRPPSTLSCASHVPVSLLPKFSLYTNAGLRAHTKESHGDVGNQVLTALLTLAHVCVPAPPFSHNIYTYRYKHTYTLHTHNIQTHTNTLTHYQTLIHTHTHTHTQTHYQTLTHNIQTHTNTLTHYQTLIHTHKHTYTLSNTHTHTHTYTRTHSYIHTQHANTHTKTHAHTYTHTHTYIRIHTHHTHTHTHTK